MVKNPKKQQSTNIKRDEINTIKIINDNTFNLHYSLLNNNNAYMKVTLKSKRIGVARGILKDIFSKKNSALYMPSNTVNISSLFTQRLHKNVGDFIAVGIGRNR